MELRITKHKHHLGIAPRYILGWNNDGCGVVKVPQLLYEVSPERAVQLVSTSYVYGDVYYKQVNINHIKKVIDLFDEVTVFEKMRTDGYSSSGSWNTYTTGGIFCRKGKKWYKIILKNEYGNL